MIETRVGGIDNRLFVAELDISQAESEIKQTKDSIESRVTSSEARSIFRQEADKFTFNANQIDFNSSPNTSIELNIDRNSRKGGTRLQGDSLTFFPKDNDYMIGGIESWYEDFFGTTPKYAEIKLKHNESFSLMRIASSYRSYVVFNENNVGSGYVFDNNKHNGKIYPTDFKQEVYFSKNAGFEKIEFKNITIYGGNGYLYFDCEELNKALKINFHTGKLDWL